jgi:hypothetical protein
MMFVWRLYGGTKGQLGVFLTIPARSESRACSAAATPSAPTPAARPGHMRGYMRGTAGKQLLNVRGNLEKIS